VGGDVIGADVGQDRRVEVETAMRVPDQGLGAELHDEALHARLPTAMHEGAHVLEVVAHANGAVVDPGRLAGQHGRA
jgi:hypothetical protein